MIEIFDKSEISARDVLRRDNEKSGVEAAVAEIIAAVRARGGWGIISSWVTLFAPRRRAVATQSLPVSPPPTTSTFLPSASLRGGF